MTSARITDITTHSCLRLTSLRRAAQQTCATLWHRHAEIAGIFDKQPISSANLQNSSKPDHKNPAKASLPPKPRAADNIKSP